MFKLILFNPTGINSNFCSITKKCVLTTGLSLITGAACYTYSLRCSQFRSCRPLRGIYLKQLHCRVYVSPDIAQPWPGQDHNEHNGPNAHNTQLIAEVTVVTTVLYILPVMISRDPAGVNEIIQNGQGVLENARIITSWEIEMQIIWW